MSSAVFRLENVAFAYPQDGRGLPVFSLSIDTGQGVLVSGPSGCGKSTLARCLTGLIPHLYNGELHGEVWLNGIPTHELPLWQIAEQVGIVFQNPATQMLAPTVEDEIIFGLENLGLPPAEISSRLESTLEQFNLQPLRFRTPQTLSGGEQQKVALAAILARQPPALVLDEPLSMLDSTAAREFVDHLGALIQSGRTVVICEHRQEFLARLPGLQRIELGHNPQAGSIQPEQRQAGKLVDLNPPPFDQNGPDDFCLRAGDLTVKRGGKKVIDNMSLDLPGGQVVAIVGRNGSGKTTLLRAIAGLQPHQGQLVVTSRGQDEQPNFGIVFQNPDLQIFNPTVRQEILYHLPDPDLERYAWLIEALGLGAYEETPPLLISEGEKRRLALAMVLMRQPRHGVLLDEPSLGQDRRHKERLAVVLKSLTRTGKLVILATHDLELAAQADQIILLSPDGLVGQGLPVEVFRQAQAWERLGLWVPDWVG